MKLKIKQLTLFLILSGAFVFNACTSKPYPIEGGDETAKAPSNSITLIFTGDVMAHNVNYRMKDYNIIWNDLRDDFKRADFTFANIEAPVDTTKEASNYPYFNMPESYVQAAIDSGINVFSLCNNHSNDQKLEGVLETIKTTEKLSEAADDEAMILLSNWCKKNRPKLVPLFDMIKDYRKWNKLKSAIGLSKFFILFPKNCYLFS